MVLLADTVACAWVAAIVYGSGRVDVAELWSTAVAPRFAWGVVVLRGGVWGALVIHGVGLMRHLWAGGSWRSVRWWLLKW